MTAVDLGLPVVERGPWWGMPASADVTIAGVRAVLPHRVLDDAVVVIRDGVIRSVVQATRHPAEAVDGRGALLLPGLIDVHSDALEGEINPRPNTEFPLAFAVRAFEQRLVGFGLTTVCNGVGFADNNRYGRTLDRATAMCTSLAARHAEGTAPVEHLVLHRIDIRSEGAVAALEAVLPHAGLPAGALPLVSAEDHTPGQGQFRDVERFVRARMAEGLDESAARATVAERIAVRDALLPHQAHNSAELTRLARAGAIRLYVHDPETPEDVADAAARAVAVAEFPLSVATARAAIDIGMPTVMGAPNVIRGGSHSGNVSAEEVVAAGLCTALASDYQPAALLGAAFLLASRGVIDLAGAVALVTSGPALVAGLAGRGSIVAGQRGDVVLVDIDGGWPRPIGVHRAR